MKILHVMGGKLDESNGIGKLMTELIFYQNKYLTGTGVDLLLLDDQKIKTNNFPINYYSEISFGFLKNYDLVVFHGIYYLKFLILSFCLSFYKKPYLIKPHSSLMYAAQKKSYYKKKFFNFLFFNAFINNSSGIIFTSEGERIRSCKFDRLSFIEPNGLNIPKLYPHSTCASVKRFIYIGRIDIHHKGLDVLLDSLEILKNKKILDKIDFKFYGLGTEVDVREFSSRLSQLKSSNVSFNGPIFSNEKYISLASSDIFVLTSRYEGVPMIILESLSQELPCLVTPETNIGESVESFNFGWIVNLKSEEIASKIIDILEMNESDIIKKRSNARNYILNHHSWHSVIKNSEQIFNTILKRVSL